MSDTSDLLDGLTADLVTAGLGTDATSFTADDTALIQGDLPADPDRVIAMRTYRPGGDHPSQPLGQIRVQFRVRGLPDEPLDADTLTDALYLLFHGMTDRTYGSLHVIQMLHQSTVPNGVDEHNRCEAFSNYVLDVDFPPSANRAD